MVWLPNVYERWIAWYVDLDTLLYIRVGQITSVGFQHIQMRLSLGGCCILQLCISVHVYSAAAGLTA